MHACLLNLMLTIHPHRPSTLALSVPRQMAQEYFLKHAVLLGMFLQGLGAFRWHLQCVLL